MKYADAIAYFDTLSQFGEKLGLERIRQLCARAGEPQTRFSSVLVGGTNGKGSTSTMLGTILHAAGYRVGTSPKPHLYSHRERLQVDGEPISEEALAALVREVRRWVEAVAAEPEVGQPTVFEVITLLAFLHFARSGVDWAVVEVGLGGRFDATNVLQPVLSVITNIGLDHTDRLGETLEAIAGEKAGILRAFSPAITAARPPGLGVIEAHAAALSAPLGRLGQEILIDAVRLHKRGSVFDVTTPGATFSRLEVRMPGAHQVENAALAAAAAVKLRECGADVPENAIRQGLATAVIPGRLEAIDDAPLTLLDAAHNPDGARALAAALRDLYLAPHPGCRLHLVLGISRAHQPADVLAPLAPLAAHVYAAASRHPAALPAAATAVLARAHGAPTTIHASVPEAVAAARAAAGRDDLVCVTGSIFTIAEVERAPIPTPL
jgi:dihydrofolate synthase/folylpolyglutamate synthase